MTSNTSDISAPIAMPLSPVAQASVDTAATASLPGTPAVSASASGTSTPAQIASADDGNTGTSSATNISFASNTASNNNTGQTTSGKRAGTGTRSQTALSALEVHSVDPLLAEPLSAFGASVAGSVALELRSATTRAATQHAAGDKTAEEWIESALAQIGWGSYQKRLFWLCSLGWLNDALWYCGMAYVLPGIAASFGLSSTLVGLVMTLFYGGSAVGEIIWGSFSAYYGRRITFGITLGMCGVSGGLMALMPTFWAVCVFSGFLGIGYGGNVALDSCLYLEWIPKEKASTISLMNGIFWVGSVVPALLAWGIMPLTLTLFDHPAYINTSSWRVLVLTMAGINLVMLACRRLLIPLYETPFFSAAKDDWERASADLRRVASYNGNPMSEKDAFEFEEYYGIGAGREPRNRPVKVATAEPTEMGTWSRFVKGVKGAWHSLKETWDAAVANDPLLRRTTILLFTFWVLFYLGGVMFTSLLAVILTDIGLTNESDTYRDLVIYSIAPIPSAILCRYMLDWPPLGRVGTTWSATLFMAASLIGFGVVAFETAKGDEGRHAALEAGSIVTTVFYNVGLQVASTALWLYTPELYPTAHRTQLLGLAMSLGRISSMVAPLIGGALLTVNVYWKNALLPFVSAGVLTFAALLAFAMPLETLPEAAKLGVGRQVARSVTQLELGKAENGSSSGMVDVPLGSSTSLIKGNNAA